MLVCSLCFTFARLVGSSGTNSDGNCYDIKTKHKNSQKLCRVDVSIFYNSKIPMC
jgi:hypothetical protein